jgi:hypothetical protein
MHIETSSEFVRSQPIRALLDLLYTDLTLAELESHVAREQAVMVQLGEFQEQQGLPNELFIGATLNAAACLLACELEEEASRRRREEGGNR